MSKLVPFPITAATLAADAASLKRAEAARTQLKVNRAQATLGRIDAAYNLTSKENTHEKH